MTFRRAVLVSYATRVKELVVLLAGYLRADESRCEKVVCQRSQFLSAASCFHGGRFHCAAAHSSFEIAMEKIFSVE